MMISREDFIFTIGYEGDTAVVDGKAKAQYGKLSTVALAEEGLYRSAFASALHSETEEDLQAFAAIFNAKAGTSYKSVEEFMRLFGVKQEKVKRVMIL